MSIDMSTNSPIHSQISQNESYEGVQTEEVGTFNTQQRSHSETKLSGNVSGTWTKPSKRDTYKDQKRNYRIEKKRVAKELISTLKDPSVIVMHDWLKVRGTLKSWTKLYCTLKPGLLVLSKSYKQKSGHWVGTILLSTCELIERPSKKDGFCFKLFHPLDQSIWAQKGPKGETLGALTQPLPYSYLIFRAPSEPAGKCWMDALELALRCSSLLVRSMTKDAAPPSTPPPTPEENGPKYELNESDCEKHFDGLEEDESKTDREDVPFDYSESDHSDEDLEESIPEAVETQYSENATEELGQQGDACQTEEVEEENKSLIWSLVKQVRPGMDLSKVVLPTFILETRSFLDKLSDYYYHSDLLSEAVHEEDAYGRIKAVVKWYLSGFYKKPKGLKKPYNPILGETFRCYWHHTKTNSKTFYVAEQISHHPPVSAFYVTNRREGFAISGSILAKSKFYGNSLSAILDGAARLTLLKRGEEYVITMPYAHCKGILIGTLTMEMGGKVSIACEKTGYKAEIEFKLKPFLGSGEASNRIVGKVKFGHEALACIEGHWDDEIFIKEKSSNEQSLFWSPTPEIKSKRLKRFTVPVESQSDMESERLWRLVSEAIQNGDQNGATREKTVLEEEQRRHAKERKAKNIAWVPKLFEKDCISQEWIYKYADLRPWDRLNDVVQFESNFKIQTKTKHRTRMVRTLSIARVDDDKRNVQSGSSDMLTDSTVDNDKKRQPISKAINKALEPVIKSHQNISERLTNINNSVQAIARRQDNDNTLFIIAALLISQVIIAWLMK
ncbi:DgyrCDS10592 [Dimorphilus gyrociliatus]|uniref:Oxysterol-binding protein n=1 Tax=Dimorphilus gyrociliatus TaxID=2664684 RepID=A0A7I8W0R5_9ANNE|nr:DgyrCDS10592 [Dimorphilus gyrociliatus]